MYDIINFVLCYDMNVHIPAIKLIHDIIKLHSRNKKVNIYIIEYDLTIEHLNEMEDFLNSKNLENYDIFIKKVKKNELSTYATASYISPITNYRYYIWKLGLENTKIMYLDIDIQLQKPLFEYYNLNFEEDVAAVQDFKRTVQNNFKSFSTGCMLINLKDKKYNDEIFRKLNEFHSIHRDNINADQWCLNNVFKDRCYYLDNYFEFDMALYVLMYYKSILFDEFNFIKNKYDKIDNFYIIHYNGEIKPYHDGVIQKIKREMLKLDRYKLI